ncbi:MAG TPA: outer membrane beta-barrel protein, partial [Saprospiraceae bacterium]|nr:outer membrane beta-barrel protein [Saprospiraceae bacterium]
VTVQTDKNLAEVDYYSFNANIPLSSGKWWNSSNNLSFYRGIYRGQYAGTHLNDGNWVFDFTSTNSFVLGHDWSAELSFNYHTREIYAFMDLDPMWNLSMGLQKQVFHRQGTIKLSLTDIFWTSLPAADITFDDYHERFDVFRDTRQIALSYTQRFGDNQLAPSRRRTGGAEEEKQRASAGSQG